MADQKLTQLPAVPDPVVDSDLVYLVRGTDSYQATIAQVHASITPGAAVWGDITGTLTDQIDLANALALKASASGLAAHIADTANPHATTKTQVGLGNADNTSDANKPVSTATQTALDLKAPLASPALTGVPTAPTASLGTNTTQLATTAFVIANSGGGGTVTSVTSADGNATVANTTTTPVITIVSAPKWATARNLAGNSVDGSGNVAFANKFIVQGTADSGLSAAQFLGALATGIVKNTTTTGVLSIAVAGDFPTLNQNTTGSAATLTTPRAINGVNFDGSAAITVTAAAGTLSGTTLASGVVTSSLTAVGDLVTGSIGTGFVVKGVTLTLGSDANYDLYYRNSSGVLTRLANGTTGQFLAATTSNAPSWGTPSGSGTVTASGGPLTANAIVLGNGTTDTKVVAGIITDGASMITLGVNTTTLGKLKLFGNTSGDATIQPAAVAGTSTVLTLPAITDTLVGKITTQGTYYYSIYDYASGSQLTGGADATAALQNALNAIETAMKANDGGKYILDLRDSILRIDGALVSTNSNNAQITLPALDVFADPQCTLVIRGSAPVSMAYSVIGTVAIPTKGAIIRSTLTTGGGTLPSVIAGRAPTASSWLFSSILLVFENIEIQTVANPLIGGLNAGYVNSLEMRNSSVTTGIYTVADVTTPTHADAIAVTGPRSGNGVNNHYHNVGVIGFYTGFKLNEHCSGDVMAFGCLTAVEVTQMNNVSRLDHIVSAHCVTSIRATGGVSFMTVGNLDIEHAASGAFAPGNDIEDTNNYLSGKCTYGVVLAGVGPSTVFAKNGGVYFECAAFGTNDIPVWNTLSGTTPAIAFLPTPQVRTLTLSGNTTFTASGYAKGLRFTLFLTGDAGASRTLTFPAWTWLEGTPAGLASSKVMQIDLTCMSTTAGSVIAVYGVQQ